MFCHECGEKQSWLDSEEMNKHPEHAAITRQCLITSFSHLQLSASEPVSLRAQVGKPRKASSWEEAELDQRVREPCLKIGLVGPQRGVCYFSLETHYIWNQVMSERLKSTQKWLPGVIHSSSSRNAGLPSLNSPASGPAAISCGLCTLLQTLPVLLTPLHYPRQPNPMLPSSHLSQCPSFFTHKPSSLAPSHLS